MDRIEQFVDLHEEDDSSAMKLQKQMMCIPHTPEAFRNFCITVRS
jgi:hypothetical protein